jgi:hypothetical protein
MEDIVKEIKYRGIEEKMKEKKDIKISTNLIQKNINKIQMFSNNQ